jgi:hypothetical protein
LRRSFAAVSTLDLEALTLRGKAIHAYMRNLRAGARPPDTMRECRVIDGAGVINGPELSHVGRTRNAKWLRAWIPDSRNTEERARLQIKKRFGWMGEREDNKYGVQLTEGTRAIPL